MRLSLQKYYRDPLYRNSIALVLSQAFLSFFGLFFWIVATHTMAATVVGLATAAISASTLISFIAGFGLGIGVVRYLPSSDRKRELTNTVNIVTLFASIAAALIFLGGLNIFSPPLLLLRQGPLLFQFVLNVALSTVLTTQMYIFIALRRSDRYLVQCIVLGLRVPLLLLFAPLGVFGVLVAVNVASLPPILFGIVELYRHKLSLRLETNKETLREIAAFSVGNYAATILSMLPSTIVPVLIVNTIGAAPAAYFYVAYNIAAFSWIVPSAVGASFFVEGSHDMPIREYTVKSLRFAVLLAAPLVIFILIFGNQLLSVFGVQYVQQSAALVRLLVGATVFQIPIAVYIAIKRIQLETKIINFVNLLMAASVIGLGYACLLSFGLIGIGYAWVASGALVCVLIGWLARANR